MDGEESFALPAARMRSNLLQQFIGEGSNKHTSRAEEEAILQDNGVDFILVRVSDENTVALAEAIRQYQFPQDCNELDKRSQGRIFMTYGERRRMSAFVHISCTFVS